MVAPDSLARCSFLPDGAQQPFLLPAEDIDIEGALREVMHEYMHVPGGDPEKMGRKPYIVHVSVDFAGTPLDDAPAQTGLGIYADFNREWPHNVNQLTRYFDEGKTGIFTAPNLPNPIRAYCSNWSRKFRAAITSGEKATLTFKEHSKRDHLFNAAAIVGRAYALENRVDALFQAIEEFYAPTGSTPSIFDAINNAIGSVLELRDMAASYDQLAAGKVEILVDLFQEADRTVVALQHPENAALFDAFCEVWVAAQDLANDVQGKLVPVRSYITPIRMNVLDVATAIYGDAQRTSDIMALNDFRDPYAIPSGFSVAYYDDAA